MVGGCPKFVCGGEILYFPWCFLEALKPDVKHYGACKGALCQLRRGMTVMQTLTLV